MKITPIVLKSAEHPTLPFDQPPGTAFAVQALTGELVAAGVRLSVTAAIDQTKREEEIQAWLNSVGAHADQISSLTNLATSGVDLAAVAMPGLQINPAVHGGLDGLAFVSNSASLVNALNSGDSYAATQFSLTAGASAIDLIADSGMFKFSNTLHGAALALKFGKEAYVAYHQFKQQSGVTVSGAP